MIFGSSDMWFQRLSVGVLLRGTGGECDMTMMEEMRPPVVAGPVVTVSNSESARALQILTCISDRVWLRLSMSIAKLHGGAVASQVVTTVFSPSSPQFIDTDGGR
jgi:hypothetical protein